MRSPMRIFLPMLLLVDQVSRIGASCTLCYQGETAALLDTGFFTPNIISCASAATLIQKIPAENPQCASNQLTGYKNCGCPSIPENYCSMCQDNEFELPIGRKFKTIPLATLPNNTLCVDAVFRSNDTGLCDEYKRAEAFCGCPGAPTPICHAVCRPPSSSIAVAARNSAPVTVSADRLLPPLFEMTCDDLYEQSPFYWTTEECSALQDPSYDLIDESAYCCSDDAPQESLTNCNLCAGGTLTNPTRLVTVNDNASNGGSPITMTCQDLEMLSFAVTDDQYCQSVLQQPDFLNACCMGWSDPPSGSPTSVPSLAPSAEPSLRNPTASPSELEVQAQQKSVTGTTSAASLGQGMHWAMITLTTTFLIVSMLAMS